MSADTGPGAGTAFRVPVDIRRLPWIRRLAADYSYDFGALAPFFAGDPTRPAAWRRAIDAAATRTRARDALVERLAAQQRRRGAPPVTIAAAERLRDPRSVAIVTGQQAGLFGGPTFTLLKALTAIRLAHRVSADYGVPASAVFWIDAEDHDWNEVKGCGVLDAEYRRRTITLDDPRGAGELPVAEVRLDASANQTIAELQTALTPTEFTADMIRVLRLAYEIGAAMTEAFGRWLESLLGPLGLVVFDGADPTVKPLVRDVFTHELRHPGRTAALAAAAGRELTARGYHAQVTPHEESVALFRLDGVRRPIRRTAEGFLDGDRTVVPEQLIEEVAANPAAFSPNVLLRPIVQDTLFPTACYVPGPSELAYLGQLRGVYEHFGVPMPLLHPRATATIVDSAAARFLSRYEVPLDALQPEDEGALNRLLEATLPRRVEQAYEEAARGVAERMGAVIAAVPAIDPTLEGAARSTLGRMERDLHALHSKIIQAAKRRDETLRRQFHRTRAQVFPDGEPQERALGFVYFLNRYGPGLIERLAGDLPLDPGVHWVLTV
jgi:bacillithiol biosynthesis cysteine-adding enzyme BshC